MIRLAVVFICLAILAAFLTVTGLAGDYHSLVKMSFLCFLLLFIITAAASAWQGEA